MRQITALCFCLAPAAFLPAHAGAQGSDCIGPICNLDTAEVVGVTPLRYPARALRAGIEGWVELELTVNAGGEVVEVRVADAAPPGVFEEAARETARSWRFVTRPEQPQRVLTPRIVFDFIRDSEPARGPSE